MREHLLYIDGKWRAGGAGTTLATSPSSGETFAQVAVADPADVDAAVAAAAAAWPAWAGTSPSTGPPGAGRSSPGSGNGATSWPGR